MVINVHHLRFPDTNAQFAM